MAKVKNHEADISNDNDGTSGVNITREKNLKNTKKQIEAAKKTKSKKLITCKNTQ